MLFNGGAPDDAPAAFGFRLEPSALIEIATGRSLPLDRFRPGEQIHAVAGIGNPERFFATLEALNWRPIPHPFADHAAFSPEQLHFAPDLPLVMTEKDAVKCRAFARPGWYYLQVQARPCDAFVAWFDERLARLFPEPT